MKKLALTTALGAACLGLAACGDNRADNAAEADNMSATGEMGGEAGMAPGEGNAAAGSAGGAGAGAGTTTTTTTTSSTFPKGARIVEENGVTYRVDADGTRARLGDTDSRIVVENGVRYRVDPGGTRVKINDRGLDIDLPDLTPDVDVGVNKKGNLDVDVKNKKDGNDGPN
jgi:hypothetical protein